VIEHFEFYAVAEKRCNVNEPTNPYRSPTETTSSDRQAIGKPLWLKFNGPLPTVCALCGESATEIKSLLMYGFWGELVHIFINADRIFDGAILCLPLCHEHRRFRQWWPMSAAVILLVPILSLPVLFFAFRQQLTVFVTASAILLGLGMYFAIRVTRRALQIYLGQINRSGVVLTGLHPTFVSVVEELQSVQSHDVAANIAQQFQQTK
jgi:hypothetical protein